MAKINRRRDPDGITIFSYTCGNSFLHRAPAGIKLAALCLFTFFIFSAPWPALAAAGSILGAVIIYCGFSPVQFFREQKGIVWYSLFLLLISIPGLPGNAEEKYVLKILPFCSIYPLRALPVLLFTAKLILTAIAAALMFKTTSSSQIRICIENIETVFPVKKRTGFSLPFALLIIFIPRIFESWNGLERAWKARGGSQGIQKITILLPVLLSDLLNRGNKTGTAIRARKIMN